MNTILRALLPLATILACLAVNGCGDKQPPVVDGSAANREARMEARIAEALSELEPEDRALAVAQKLCPLTDEALGSMGPPIKIVLEGQPVFICCQGCEDLARQKSAEMLAKVKKATTAE